MAREYPDKRPELTEWLRIQIASAALVSSGCDAPASGFLESGVLRLEHDCLTIFWDVPPGVSLLTIARSLLGESAGIPDLQEFFRGIVESLPLPFRLAVRLEEREVN